MTSTTYSKDRGLASAVPPFPLDPSYPGEEMERGWKGDQRKPSVLIFSRDKDSRLLYRTMVELWGYEARDVADLNSLEAHRMHGDPCVLLYDTILPFSENLHAIHRLRRAVSREDMPIILVSGFSQPLFRSLAIMVGADDFLVKPVDFDTLESVLQRSAQ
jgi:two-component system, NtrC family, response regulator HydG